MSSNKRPARRPALKTSKHGGRALAWTGMLFGFAVSVAANMADEFVKHNGEPEVGALVLAFLLPFVLLFTTEVMARVDWPRHWAWMVARLVGLLPVAGVAAWLSYWHLQSLTRHYGESEFSSHIAPLAIDGFMLMCSVALLAPAAVAKQAAARPAPAVVAAPVVSDAPAPVERRRPDITDLIPMGEAVLAQMAENGERVSKARLGAALREQGVKASKERVSALHDHLVTA